MLPCHQCGRDNSKEHNNFFVFSGGALVGTADYATMMEQGIALANLEFHPDSENSTNRGASVDLIADRALNHTNGQFEMHFCSIECLKSFLLGKIQELERKMNGDT